MARKGPSSILLSKVYSDPQYQGKHVIIIGGKVFTAKTGIAASRMFDRLIKEYPKETPTITYIPKAEALILFS